MGRFHVTIIRPQGYVHSDCFYEVAEGLCRGLMDLGHDVTFAENWIEPSASTIVLGAQLMDKEWVDRLTSKDVVYNLEQFGVSYTPEWYMELAARAQIWDFTSLQLERWRAVPCLLPPRAVEIGYHPSLRRIQSADDPDIDVLFYGAMTERRKWVVDALSAEGMKVTSVFGVYGAERDALIARSKVVLNLHAQDTRIFEVVRVSYLLSNGKAVVVEGSDDMGELKDAVAVCTYGSAVEVCKRVVKDERERKELERRGFEVFSRRMQAEILREVVGAGGA